MFKSRTKFLAVMACLSVFLLCGTLAFCLETQNLGSNVNIQYVAPPPSDELFNSNRKTFYKVNLNKLLQQISNDATSSISNMAKVDSLASTKTTAGTMRTYTIGKSSGEDITVLFGGLKWTVTYLSTDKNGDSILTLWLDNCIQDAWKDRRADEGEYYGYLNGGLYSDWSANWYKDNPKDSYPSSMYGASYIRTVTLNNGGSYATSGSAVVSCAQTESSAFALFTMQQYGLTQYIVKPSNVSWQENWQDAKTQLSLNYNLPNENWSPKVTGLFNGNYNYAGKDANDDWAEDYLWLPSLTETGYDTTRSGIWVASYGQRKNADGSTASTIGNVGSANGAAYNNSWLRSGTHNDANYAYYINPSGTFNNRNSVNYSYAVRPALHLNLTKAAAAAV